MRPLALKVDACTHAGMRDGVPRLLDLFARRGVRASFFLAFGPDNAGKAIYRVFRPGFLRKMLRTGAPSLYGMRTVLSGTLLPARPIAAAFPGTVARIAAEGHEVGVHGWDHRLWQDRLPRMAPGEILAEVRRAVDACASALGRPPVATGAPGWQATEASLEAQDGLGLLYASDLRNAPPCLLRAGGRVLRTPQVPTDGPCLEELLAAGIRGHGPLADRIAEACVPGSAGVLPLHAEVEGGPFLGVLEAVLDRVAAAGRPLGTLGDLLRDASAAGLPVLDLVPAEIPGRSGPVASAG